MSEENGLFGVLVSSWEDLIQDHSLDIVHLPVEVKRSILDIVEVMELSDIEERAVWALFLGISRMRQPF